MAYVIICSKNHHHKDKDQKHEFFKDASKILWDPPQTWHSLMGTPNKIIDMEYGELKDAESKGDIAKWKENLLHLAAACGLAILDTYHK
jgi:hypothetical protein